MLVFSSHAPPRPSQQPNMEYVSARWRRGCAGWDRHDRKCTAQSKPFKFRPGCHEVRERDGEVFEMRSNGISHLDLSSADVVLPSPPGNP